VNPRWTGFTHTAKAQMQCLDDLTTPSETSLNSKIFNAGLTRSLIPARSCGAVRKISNFRSKTRARFGYMTYRSGCTNAVNRACAEKLAMCRRFQCSDSTSCRRSRAAGMEHAKFISIKIQPFRHRRIHPLLSTPQRPLQDANILKSGNG